MTRDLQNLTGDMWTPGGNGKVIKMDRGQLLIGGVAVDTNKIPNDGWNAFRKGFMGQ